MKENMGKECIMIVLYAVVFLFFIFKMFYYMEEIWYVPDEDAHISYIGYIEENPDRLIPDFMEMKLYGGGQGGYTLGEGSYYFIDLQRVCYLGHPPLYYRMMHGTGAVLVENGKLYADLYSLKIANIILTAFTMLLILYYGYSRIRTYAEETVRLSPVYHGIFAVTATSVPMLAFCGSGVINDNLSNLGFILFLFGISRYYEKKTGYLTYLLVGAGFMVSFFSKLTLGELVLVMLLVIFVAEWVRNRNWKLILNKYFLASLPFYLITAAYFIYIFFTYHSLQPGLEVTSSEELAALFSVPEENRVSMSFLGYTLYYMKNFFLTWAGIYNGDISLLKIDAVWLQWPFYLILVLFAAAGLKGAFHWLKRKEGVHDTVFAAAFAAVLITFLTQYISAYQSFLNRGYTGGYQARYYLCVLPVIALANVNVLKHAEGLIKGRRAAGYAVRAALCLYLLWMLYADFFYFILHFEGYMW